ncbi:MAG: SAM-dependent methyltransferase [Bryobacteraceae bacterium]
MIAVPVLPEQPLSAHKKHVSEFYDLLSPHFRKLWGEHLHDGFYKTGAESKEAAQEDLVAYLAVFAGLPHGARGLDIGCGMGATSVWLARNLKARMTGITLSATQVSIARELAARKGVDAEFLQMDAERYEPGEPFDFAWMLGVLGHFEDQQGFVRTVARLVRPGARFLLADWVSGPGLTAADRQRFVEPVLEGMLMPDIASLQDYAGWFNANGFRVLESRDLTRETSKTWDQGLSILQAPEIVRMAWEGGRQAVGLIAAVHGMRTAMAKGMIRYGVLVAEKL